MLYSANITVPANTDITTATLTKIFASPGVIHQVDFLFPVASNREVYAKLFVGNYQLIPSNLHEAIRANNTVVSTREFYTMQPGDSILTIMSWNVHAADDMLLSVNIGVLPKKVLMPFDFDELLTAALAKDIEQ